MMESHSDLIEKYKISVDAVVQRRGGWNSITKTLVFDALTEIAATIGSDWFVQKNDQTTNWESVVLGEPNKASDIRKETNNLLRRGASLTFGQGANGRIYIWMAYPYVDELETPVKNKVLNVLEPSDLDDVKISSYVTKFFEELLSTSDQNSPGIGFEI